MDVKQKIKNTYVNNNDKKDKKNKKESCKKIYNYLKEKCHTESIKYLNNREHFTSGDNNFECLDLKYKFNHYCFHLYPDIKKY